VNRTQVRSEKSPVISLSDSRYDLQTAEKLAQIEEVIEKYRDKEGCLIQILHEAQEIFGSLPIEVQEFIAKSLNLPLSEVSGVLSFYSFFSVKPRGQHTVRVCLGTACYVRGGKKIVDHLCEALNVDVGDTTEDGKFTFEIARCIGACGLAPAVMIDDTVYKQVTPAKIDAILSKY
jgi:NADH:ubiquinone oxidoreductase subunit E